MKSICYVLTFTLILNACTYLRGDLLSVVEVIEQQNEPSNDDSVRAHATEIEGPHEIRDRRKRQASSCVNVNDATCNYYIGLGIKCSSSAYIGSIPFTSYCCRSCNSGTTTSPCSSNPCQNGGICSVVGTTAYTCTCSQGYTGMNCQTLVGSCNLNPCMNGGLCTNLASGSYSCQCLSSFTGNRCETSIQTTASPTCVNINDNTCSFFISRGIQCSSTAYIGTTLFSTYCCRSCNGGGSAVTTQSPMTTTRPTTCFDVLPICPNIIQYCSQLASNANHPCRKSCNLC